MKNKAKHKPLKAGDIRKKKKKSKKIESRKEKFNRSSDNQWSWAQLVQKYRNNQNLQAAIQLLEEISTTSPHNPALWVNLAILRGQVEDFAGATKATEELLKLTPKYFDAWTHLARFKSKAGDWDGALEALEVAENLKPDHVITLCLLSKLYLQRNASQKVIQKISGYIDRNPHYRKDKERAIILLHYLLHAQIKLQNYNRTEETVNSILELDENDAFALHVQSKIDNSEQNIVDFALEQYGEYAP